MQHGRSTSMTAAITTFIILVTLFGALFILWGVWAAIMGVYDEFSQRKRKAMATPMDIDELKMRRLAKAVRQRIQTRKIMNRGFTFIELIIVLAIFGTLSWLALTTVDRIQKARASFLAECRYPKIACEDMWRNRVK